jgi:hypothetical protein
MARYRFMGFTALKRKSVLGVSAATPVTVLLLFLVACALSIPPTACAADGLTTNPDGSHTYTTKFPLTENPISENGAWINGKTVGLDWTNVRTTPGFAFGTEIGNSGYDDSTAVLAGTWGPDQTVEATVHTTVSQNDNIYAEVELRLRSSLSAHRATGYEVNFRCSKSSNAYTQIVRWNGPLGSFSYVNAAGGSRYGVADGDVVKATIVGNVITVYINNTKVLQGTDSTFTSGSPGIGFYLQGATGLMSQYGFTSFTATDGSGTSSSGTPAPPTNLTAIVH